MKVVNLFSKVPKNHRQSLSTRRLIIGSAQDSTLTLTTYLTPSTQKKYLPIRLFLARHGETYWNVEERLQGQLDSDLTTLGQQQAQRLAEYVAQHNIQAVFSSPLARAQKTAQICAQRSQIPIITCNSLIERHLGQWQKKKINVVKSLPDYFPVFCRVNHASPPDGESGIDAAQRFSMGLSNLLLTYLEEQIAPTSTAQTALSVAVVAHGEVMRCFMANVDPTLNSSTQNAFHLFTNAGVTELLFHAKTRTFTRC